MVFQAIKSAQECWDQLQGVMVQLPKLKGSMHTRTSLFLASISSSGFLKCTLKFDISLKTYYTYSINYRKMIAKLSQRKRQCRVWKSSKRETSVVLRIHSPPNIDVGQYTWTVANRGSSHELQHLRFYWCFIT